MVSVVIANSLHLKVVRGLIEAGKHVLCEKPLSDTLASARKMADLAREASSIVASASPTAASFHQDTPSQVRLYLNDDHSGRNGYRTVNLGSDHPYVAGGMPIDVSGVGFGQNEGFTYQARAFLEEVAGIPEEESLPRNASFDEGVHNMEILAAVARSAADNGKQVNL